MVMPDWSRAPKGRLAEIKGTARGEGEPFQLGRPMDRLAAAIVDVFVVFAPLYILISAPFKRWLTESYILGSEPDFALTVFLMICTGVVLLVVYQTTAYFFFSTTLGKKLFDLKVVSVFNEAPSFWSWAGRSAVWVAELMLFGLPWLAVFSNGKRRPLHDRVSDTIVVSSTDMGVAAPLQWERSLVTSVFAMFLGLAALSFSIQMHEMFERIKMEESFASLADKEAGHCDVVSAHTSAEEGEAEKPVNSRLKTAMVLYAAGIADRSCLEAEVEREMTLQIPISPVTYLAQAFVYADDAEVSNAYLDEVCEVAGDSVECAMSRLVSAWSDEDWLNVEEILANTPSGSGYMEIWGIRHYMKQAKYGQALDLLNSLIGRKAISEFSLVQRVKALQSMYLNAEAQTAYQQAMSALEGEESRDLSAWLCSQQLQSSCQAADGLACRHMHKTEGLDLDFERPSEALAQLMAQECKAGVDYLKLSEKSREDSWQTFFRANLKRDREDRAVAASLFVQVIQAKETPDILRVEATRRLAKFASAKQMEMVVDLWSEFESRDAWVKAGNILFARLAEQNNAELALKVGRHLMNSKALSPASLNTLAVMTEPPVNARQPASAKVHEQIKNVMESMEASE